MSTVTVPYYSIGSTNIDIVKIFFVLHNKAALLTRDVLSWEQSIVTKEFLERFLTNHIQIGNIDQKINFYDSDETEIRLPFADLSQHFRMYFLVFALKFFIHGHG